MKLLQLPLSQLLLLWLLLLTTLVGVSAQQCAVEDINVMDLVLSTESIEVTHMPNINITDIYYNCLSTSRTVGLYSSASLSVVYNRSKPAAMLEVRYNVQCIRGYWHRVGRTTSALRSNDTRTDCYSCTDQSVNENHCSACNSSCTGLNQCYGPLANQCCSYNDGGVCTDDCGMNREGNSNFTCVCSNFWTGTDCDVCSLACENEGTQAPDCSKCLCVPGYEGIMCENEINECDLNPCENNGTCIDLVNDYSCQCVAGYADKNCTTDIDDCDPNPCDNDGTCTDLINDYLCQCVIGFTDENCTTNIDDCDSSPCENNATCNDLVNDYSCTCTPGYTGKDCMMDVDNCGFDPCENNGTCTDMVNDYSCECAYGFTGKDCTVDSIDNCSPDSCQNDGICIDGINSFTCNCTAGFTGDICETNINECDPNPCQNNGICTDGINSYTCTCTGFTGTDCETNIDDCVSNPCKYGGTCTDGVNGFTCTCNPVYSGVDCSGCVMLNCEQCKESDKNEMGECTECAGVFVLHQGTCINNCGIPNCIKCDVKTRKCLKCQEGYKINDNYDIDDDDNDSSDDDGTQCVGKTPEEGSDFKFSSRTMFGVILACIAGLIALILLIIAIIIKTGVHRSKKDSPKTYTRQLDEADIGHVAATNNPASGENVTQ
ncbi:fibropellin-1-like isoform X2 [Dysidea avara]|uniref:fibropellin-1-like isoform X2 n=1 Tax=Dysidea avara TaxID=196820 RepID=UPI003330E89F